MKTKIRSLYLLITLALLVGISQAGAQGTTFVYQGSLNTNAIPANGFFDFEFSLYPNAEGSGAKVGSTITQTNIGVTNGLFTTALDFGAVFTGNDTWLAMSVRSNGVGSYTALSPLQELTPTPYAIMANSASNLLGSLSAAQLSGTIALARLPGTLLTNDEGGVTLSNVTISGSFSGNGGGLSNLNASQLIGSISLAQLPVTIGLLSEPGSANVFAGPNAGNLTISGSDNVGIGGSALSAITSGSYNTAVGEGSLLTSTTATNNTAIGFNAMIGPLFGMTTGSDNTAVGVNAAAFDSTGFENAALGMDALLLNTVGNYDTAVGAYALGGGSGVTTGGGDTGLGGSTLYNITTGYNNTAAGYEALYADSTGVDNVGIGVATFQAMAAGSANTGVGTYAFQLMTAGTGNIGLGYHAGYELMAGTNNIFIGNLGSANDNEVIRIGSGQTETYTSGTLCIDGNSTNYGLLYASSGLPGISSGSGPFLFGYNGGALGGLNPTTIALSWDYKGDAWVNNNFSTGTLTIRGGADLAEPFKITAGHDEVPQGSVVVIDEENPGHLKVSSQPYDTRVAGVLSGANGINPGIEMQQQGLVEGGRNVALTGRVYVQADASNGAIKPGDLLTTSSAPGRAMKVTDHLRAQGAILGKAMSGLSAGQGMVLVLVTLQ